MAVETGAAHGPFVLEDAARERLGRHIGRALALARRDGRTALAGVTFALADPGLDFAAALLAARGPTDRWLCFEQPDRDGYGVWGLGAVRVLEVSGADRFDDASAACRGAAQRTFADDPAHDPGAPAGSGPVVLGGFAFAADGGGGPEWAGFGPGALFMPEIAIARGTGGARLTVLTTVDGDDEPGELVRRVQSRLATLQPTAMPLLDPDPTSRARVASAAPPAHFEEAVRRAVERIVAGELDKVVLAREVRVHTGLEIDPAPLFGALRTVFPGCYCYAAGIGAAAFVGASPELLVRRDGARAQTVALAGTTRRSADPAVDDHLGEQLVNSPKNRSEQAIVTRRIQRELEPVSLWVTAADDPVLVKVQNVQHLGTPIRAQLSHPVAALELAGRLHPTPAVGGEPAHVAHPLIPALEGLDRGWYAGTVGWTDLAEDGEFCVALRCALVRGKVAHLYSGCGIVADSVPADELAESEVKLQALLPLLA